MKRHVYRHAWGDAADDADARGLHYLQELREVRQTAAKAARATGSPFGDPALGRDPRTRWKERPR